MNKLFLSIFILAIGITASQAQPFKVQSAINYLKTGELEEAKTAINEATQDVKTGVQAKTWYYRGLIYQSIYDNVASKLEKVKPGMNKEQVITAIGPSKSTTANALIYDGFTVNLTPDGLTESASQSGTEDAMAEAIASYKKTREISPKNEWNDEIAQAIKFYAVSSYNSAVPYYNSRNYQEAYNRFKSSSELFKYTQSNFDSTFKDTLSTLYAGFAAARLKKNDEAKQLLQSLSDRKIEMPQIYSALGEIALAEGDTVKASQIYAAGAQKFPEDKDLMIKNLNVDLASQNYSSAVEKLKAAIAKDPGFISYYVQLGNAYDEIKDTANARKTYEQAIALDPNNFIGYFQLGVSYFNKAVDINNQMNKLPDSQLKQIDALKVKRDALFQKSLPYLERAHQIEPKDMDSMVALKQLYARLNMLDKLEAIKKEIDAQK